MTKWQYYTPRFEYISKFPDVNPVSAWIGHEYFVYDLIRSIKPLVIVELGTHKGASFFSMCQAVKDEKYDGKLFAIDTWKGDSQAGFYDESIFEEVKKIKSAYYSDLKINFIRNFFDKAVKKFSDNSINLLHIDGLHTYEAVKHDFVNWFDKITNNGIIMLHDTNEKTNNFGVYKLWKELKKKYKTIDFIHSHGLGILFKNRRRKQDILKFEIVWQKYYQLIFSERMLETQLNSQLINNQKLVNQNKQYLKSISCLEKKVKDLEKHSFNLEGNLNKIISSKTYKLWQKYCHIKNQIFNKYKND